MQELGQVKDELTSEKRLRLNVSIIDFFTVITHADDSRGSKVFSNCCVSLFLCVCLSAQRNQNGSNYITKLATGIVHHKFSPPINIWSKGQRSRVTKCKKNMLKVIERSAWVWTCIKCPSINSITTSIAISNTGGGITSSISVSVQSTQKGKL